MDSTQVLITLLHWLPRSEISQEPILKISRFLALGCKLCMIHWMDDRLESTRNLKPEALGSDSGYGFHRLWIPSLVI